MDISAVTLAAYKPSLAGDILGGQMFSDFAHMSIDRVPCAVARNEPAHPEATLQV